MVFLAHRFYFGEFSGAKSKKSWSSITWWRWSCADHFLLAVLFSSNTCSSNFANTVFCGDLKNLSEDAQLISSHSKPKISLRDCLAGSSMISIPYLRENSGSGRNSLPFHCPLVGPGGSTEQFRQLFQFHKVYDPNWILHLSRRVTYFKYKCQQERPCQDILQRSKFKFVNLFYATHLSRTDIHSFRYFVRWCFLF